MAIDWKPFRQIVDSHERFTLTSHVRPDADAVGSELALATFLDRLGKQVDIVNPSAMPSGILFLDPEDRVKKYGPKSTQQVLSNADVHIVVDTSAWVQLQDVGKVIRKSDAMKVVIDHHLSSDDLDAIEFKDTSCEATGRLIFDLAKAMQWELTKDVATYLFCAIATDTGWFRFSSTNAGTMHVIGDIMAAGANPTEIYQQLYEQNTLARLHLHGRTLARIQTACDGRLAYTSVTQNDFKETGAGPADTEEIVNECLRIKGTEIAFIAVEQQNKQIKFSLRSRTDNDVAAIAETFGGGGHKQAAGTMLTGPIASAIKKVITAMSQSLEP